MDPKLLEIVGGTAGTVIIVHYIVQIVKMMKNGRNKNTPGESSGAVSGQVQQILGRQTELLATLTSINTDIKSILVQNTEKLDDLSQVAGIAMERQRQIMDTIHRMGHK